MAHHFLAGLENLNHSFSSNSNSSSSLPLTDPTPHPPPFININPYFTEIMNPTPTILYTSTGFLPDNLFSQSPPAPANFPGLFNHDDTTTLVAPPVTEHVASNDEGRMLHRKRKAMETSSPANSSPQGSHNGIRRRKSSGRGKKPKGDENEEKPREVVHVRAKRGQATDSHSLAERVRREKINERLRCLQDIVPGCYKTMGMAVMLDEIINYVQSLQNQVEFLSMKLTAASTFYDFNTEADALETLQRAKAVEALKIQNGGLPFAPSELNFGCYPQLPHNR